jgi:hypothetical protein
MPFHGLRLPAMHRSVMTAEKLLQRQYCTRKQLGKSIRQDDGLFQRILGRF